jgi:hypothetical protein
MRVTKCALLALAATCLAFGQEQFWPTSKVPGTQQVTSDTQPVTLGLKFYSTVPGYVAAIRFYKGPGNTGPHAGALWSSNGTKLASVNFSNETGSGWQMAPLPSPVAITANTTYVVSYFAPRGTYAADKNFNWSSVNSGSLRVSGSSPGVYEYGNPIRFPSKTWQNANYYVDVIFVASASNPGSDPGSDPSGTYTISGTVGVSGATVTLSGAASKSTTSDSSGHYSFTAVSSGNYVVAPSRPGYTFNPSTRSVVISQTNATSIDFGASVVPNPVPHSVSLSWRAPASSSNVRGYNVYRTAISGGQYSKVNGSPATSTSFVDSSVDSGRTYWYAVTTVDSSNTESGYSNIATAVVPTP